MPLPRRSLIWAALLVPALLFAAPPPHPTVLMAEHDHGFRPVVAVIGTDPVISTEAGADVRLRQDVMFAAERAPYYADGSVRFDSIKLDGLRFLAIYNEGDDLAVSGKTLTTVAYFDATVTSEVPLTHAFIAIICCDGGFLRGATDRPQTQIVLHEVPDIAAGQSTKIRFSTTAFIDRKGAPFFPLLFRGGAEVRTNIAEYADRYFHRVEQVQHEAQLAAYRKKFPTGNHAAVPVMTFRPVFPPDVALPKGENHLARLFVGEDGTVMDADITPEFTSPAVQREVLRAVRGWLFLPKLVAGEPVVAQIKIPLQ